MKLTIQRDGKRVDVLDLPPGDDGVAGTIAAMQAVIDSAAADPRTRQLAAEWFRRVVPPCPAPGEKFSTPAVIYWGLRRSIRFQADPPGRELIRHPSDLLARVVLDGCAACDCDDLAVLGCTLLACLGRSFRPVLVTVGRRAAGRFEHVFFGYRRNDPRYGPDLNLLNVIPMDPQEKTPFGEWPACARRVQLWAVTVGNRTPAPPRTLGRTLAMLKGS